MIALLNLARILPAPACLIVDGAAALGAGTWCALNFWRCRHAHCLITGTGWLALALFAFAEAGTGTGHSLIGGDEQLVFVAVLAIGLIFEGAWYLTHRTNALTRTPLLTLGEKVTRESGTKVTDVPGRSQGTNHCSHDRGGL